MSLIKENKKENMNWNEKELLSQKEELFSLFSRLCEDSIPIVRRAAVVTLGKMVSILDDKEEIISNYVPLFNKLAQDDQDNVRVFAVETILEFGHIFSARDVKDYLLWSLRKLCYDPGWRVRYIAADNFVSFCQMMDSKIVQESMKDFFFKLLSDPEAEVRAIAISKIPNMTKLIGQDVTIKELIPIIKDRLVKDENKYARASLASIIIPFCYLMPHNIVMDSILGVILTILKDEFANVRLHVISNICNDEMIERQEQIMREKEQSTVDVVVSDGNNNSNSNDNNNNNNSNRIESAEKFDITLLEESIIPSIVELTLDSDWRVRLGIIDKFPALAKQFGIEFFNQRLFEVCLGSLEDSVADIRLATARNLYLIANVLNEKSKKEYLKKNLNADEFENHDWCLKHLIPSLISRMQESRHYLHRIILLLSFQYLSELLGKTKNDQLISVMMQTLEQDKVPNVRFKVCQIIENLIKNDFINSSFREKIIQTLKSTVNQDNDDDVVFFAHQALDIVDQML